MSFENRYSGFERLLHNIAFSTVGLQKAVADLEDWVYARRFAHLSIDRPVFITSLPRAGTTLLLEVISTLDTFAAHTYREMPFVLCPLFWSTVSHRYQRSGDPRERAHGDGMTVGFDSVEAFEEILWRAFWPEKYRDDRIVPWRTTDVEAYDEFKHFFTNHIRKLIVLRASGGDEPSRYVSKNNANISRIEALRRLFPDALVLVPFRNPIDHAGSMLRQHRNFMKIHIEDDFAHRYMEAIGHLEFGALLRPIDLGGWLDEPGQPAADTADFWLEYWCKVFEYLLVNASDSVLFVDYDACCAAPRKSLARIAKAIGLDDTGAFIEQADRFRRPAGYDLDELGCDKFRVEKAIAIQDRLVCASMV